MKNALIACAVALPALLGCQQKPDQEAMAECWGQPAKDMIVKLARKNLESKIAALIKAGGDPFNDEIKKRVSDSLDVTASDFYVVSVDRVADGVHCGAQIAMKYTKADGKAITANGAYIDFDIYHGETGKMYSIQNTGPLLQLVTDATSSI
ncbi:hypothetical protein [Burkholderia pseudomallei]|uniref:hypothetical protein n=1 Tax=Burkholderia pseudomallei TaxID=28450 RepID=UPI0012FE1816|nr:hypothetical protein [Burkholderia pseudomallei]